MPRVADLELGPWLEGAPDRIASHEEYTLKIVTGSSLTKLSESRFEKEGVLNPQVGKAYRDTILAKGRTEEPEALLKQFLGRDPNEEAFLRR